MAMLKVIHATLTHGTQVLHISDDSINDTSIIEVYTDNILVYPEQIAQSGTTLDITFGLYAFDVECAILVDNTTSFEVIDNLVSTSVSNALSANQGKELHDLIYALTYAINTLELSNLADVSVSNITDGQILKWDANTNKFVNANESGGGGGTSIIYDTTEHVIGKWFDRNVYRKLIAYNSSAPSSASNFPYSKEDLNADFFLNLEYVNLDRPAWIAGEIYSSSDSPTGLRFKCFDSMSMSSGQRIYLIVDYVKVGE